MDNEMLMENKSEGEVVLKIDSDRIATLIFNRPQSMNALNTGILKKLKKITEDLSDDGSIRGLILTGNGRAFVAGADLSEIRHHGMEDNIKYALLAQGVMNGIESLPFPTIAAVNGYALGGGMEIALSCDIRIAGEKSKFGMPETGLGVIPCFGATQRLPRIAGQSRAKELIFTGRIISAEEAFSYGIISRVFPQEELLPGALAIMQETLEKSKVAIKYAKMAINAGRNVPLDEGLQIERELSAICYGLPDRSEGVKAFFDKRKPVFPSTGTPAGTSAENIS